MAATIPVAFFAPAKREPIEIVQRQAARLSQTALAGTFLNASLNYMLVLNARRQIVMASDNLLELVTAKAMDQIVGLRLGEALGCVHAHESESGCGSSQSCHLCGAAKVILARRGGRSTHAGIPADSPGYRPGDDPGNAGVGDPSRMRRRALYAPRRREH